MKQSAISYVDLLDPNRILVPIPAKEGANGRTLSAKVFWNQQKGSKTIRVFGGICQIPKELLLSGEPRRYGYYGEVSQRDRIGFMPETAFTRSLETEQKRSRHVDNEDDA
jgi:hypothetical protein